MRRLLPILLAAVAGCARPAADAVILPTPAATQTPESCDPALAVDAGSGDVLLAWLGGDSLGWRLWFARAGESGTAWSAPVAVTPEGEHLHPHGEASPRLIASPGGLALVWTSSRLVPGRQWPASEVRFSRSLDGGRSWSAPITLNDDTTAAPAGHGFHGATATGDAGLAVAWLDERPAPDPDGGGEKQDDASLYVARSADFGATWEANRPAWGRVCPCCRVALAGDGKGGAVAAWRRHFPGQIRDVVIASLDGESQRVHEDGWRFEGCPHSGPAIATGDDGRTRAAWYTGAPGRNGVWYLDGSDPVAPPKAIVTGERLPVAHVSLALARRHVVVACDVDSTGERAVVLTRLATGERIMRQVSVPGSDGALYPQVGAAKGGVAYVAWTTAGDKRTVLLARAELGE